MSSRLYDKFIEKFSNRPGNDVGFQEFRDFLIEKGVYISNAEKDGGRNGNRNLLKILSCGNSDRQIAYPFDRLKEYFARTDGYYGGFLGIISGSLGFNSSTEFSDCVHEYGYCKTEQLYKETDRIQMDYYLNHEEGPLVLEIVKLDYKDEVVFGTFMFKGHSKYGLYLREISEVLSE